MADDRDEIIDLSYTVLSPRREGKSIALANFLAVSAAETLYLEVSKKGRPLGHTSNMGL